MVTGFTYGTIHLDLQGWECPTSTGVGALGMDGIGSSARHVWRPISPSLNFCNFSFKRKVNETRMYDLTMSSSLSVDAYVQSPDNSQNFNRYAYCLNNPLRFTDPSGWQYRPTPQKNNYIDYTYQYLEPRDGDIGSPYMVNYFLNGVDCSGGVGGFGGGGGSSVSYGYAVNHPQFSAEQQCSIIRNWQDNPTAMNSWMLWYAGLSDVNVHETYFGAERKTILEWECGGVSHTADFGYENVGGNRFFSQTVSNIGGDGRYMPPGYDFSAMNDGLNSSNNVNETNLQFNSSNYYRYDGHMHASSLVHTMQGGQHVQVILKNRNQTGVLLQLQDISTYYYGGWLKGKQYGGDVHCCSLLPYQSCSFDFYHFGECPYTWQFELSTVSDVASVDVRFYSDWVEGMPSSRDRIHP